MTELWDRNFSQSEIRTAFEVAISDMPRYAAGEERRSLTSAELAIGEWSKNHDRRNTRNWPFATYCTAAQPRSRTGHSGNRQAATYPQRATRLTRCGSGGGERYPMPSIAVT